MALSKEDKKKSVEQEQREREAFEQDCAERQEYLKSALRKLVSYYDDGTRHGYLMAVHQVNGDIQPIGVLGGSRPSLVSIPLVYVEPAASEKYPTVEDYAKQAGWDVKAAKPAPTPRAVSETTGTAPETGNGGAWNPERAVELFKGGMKIIDIAMQMGYARGSGCNRTKAALKKLGVL